MAGKEDLLKHDEEGKQNYREAITQLQNTVVTEQGKRLWEISFITMKDTGQS